MAHWAQVLCNLSIILRVDKMIINENGYGDKPKKVKERKDAVQDPKATPTNADDSTQPPEGEAVGHTSKRGETLRISR